MLETMSEPFDGMEIARQRIAEEAEARTGFLDLGGLGLIELPPELFELRHLRMLNLGAGIRREDGTWFESCDYQNDAIPPNQVAAQLDSLRQLNELRRLSVANLPIADLTPVAKITGLQFLDCGGTQVASLAPLTDLTALQSLDCYGTQVSDLTPLSGLAALRELDCSNCVLGDLPKEVRDLPSLQELTLVHTRIPGVPAEALSQDYGDNCLAAVRAHFQDLEVGPETVSDVKLIVLGNGRVGKTQICRRLRGEGYDKDEKSTHGILITSAQLGEGEASTRLNIWDFGGQDLYHGTHALFLRTSAVFLLVWATETENALEHEYQGIIFRNQPLPYWLAYVRHLAGTDSPVLIVQTRCDRSQDETLRPPLLDADVAGFSYHPVLQYSALNNRKREGLDGALCEAVAWLREHQGVAHIGAGRLRVQRALQTMRDADAAVPPEQRQYRTITQEHYHRLCDEAGHVSSPEQLLRYLHNAGIVFNRPGLFQDSIVLDQGWALDAIYAVFNREKCFRELKRLRGRFTRPLLELLVWGGHSVDEQRLFLGMMQSCGICFVHRRESYRDDDATEYIAPDLLPERSAVQDELDAMWDAAQPFEQDEFEFEMLHPGLARGLVCDIGGEAGVAALYWRGGVCAYETTTRSHALIEQQDMQDAWHGRIRVQTQGGQSRLLLDRLVAWIERRSGRGGLHATRLGGSMLRADIAEAAERHAGKSDDGDKAPGIFGPPPVAKPEYFVSYAWGDDTSPQGREREAIVDRLCTEAETRGIPIIRDRTTLRIGDRITPFMRRIGAGDRVFVILSEKYLRSPYCMFELLEIWRYSRGDEADFRRRVRIYALADAQARTPIERIRLARDWKHEHDEIAAMIKDDGGEIVGTQDFQRFKLMGAFYRDVPDILATMFDTVQPRSFEELEQYGFDDTPSR